MAGRPSTARSEISSALSDDGFSAAGPQSPVVSQPSARTSTINTRHDPSQGRASVALTNRSVRSPPPMSTPNNSSRPTSPSSGISRTHIPSITAQGFLRPMSSRRLQAQRMGRNSVLGRQMDSPAPIEDAEDGTEDARSVTSSRQGPYAAMPRRHRATPSIGTSYADSMPDAYESAFRGRAVSPDKQFARDSTDTNSRTQPPTALNLNQALHVGSIREENPTPRSLTSGFGIGSRHVRESGHQHLSSAGSSPRHNKTFTTTTSPAMKDLGKNYEYFEGNTIFWWGGRLQNSRDRPINIGTGIVIVLPNVLFYVFSAPYLWHHVSPALPIVAAYLFYICFSSFLHASLVDPGILPRNLHPFPPEADDPLAVGPPMNDWVMVRLAGSDTAAMDVPVKYCKTCNIWRPPRTYHCRVCDNCVETLDHHCVWLNNCVGRRNYRYFFTFVSSGTILALFLAFSSLGHILDYQTQQNVTLSHSVNVNRVPLAIFVYGILAMAYPLSLWGYHLLLTGRGETTREYLASRRFPKEERHRPFNLGNTFANWVAVFGRPKPPTYLHFKQKFEEGDQRFGPRKGNRQAPLVDEAQGGMEMKHMPGAGKSFEGPHGKISTKRDARP